MNERTNKRCRVLFVEDNEDFRTITTNFFRTRFDFNLTVAHCGNEAIQFLNGTNFDLIVTDYFMPNGDGEDILNYLHVHKIEIPVIIFSGGGYHESIFDHPKLFIMVEKPSTEKLSLAILKALDPCKSRSSD